MEEIARFLHGHPPFSQLPFDQLMATSNALAIEYFPAGAELFAEGGPALTHLYIVRAGAVDLTRRTEAGEAIVETLHEGEVMGHPSLVRGKPPILTGRARQDTLVYLLPADKFHQLRAKHPQFAQFFAAAALERMSHALMLRQSGDDAFVEFFHGRLSELNRRPPVTVEPDATVRDAARLMRQHNISSLIVDAPGGAGIITDRDLRNRVLAEGLSHDTPVAEVMSPDAAGLPPNALIFEGLLFMMERKIHHLPLIEQGRVIGVVTRTDILRRQSRNPLFLPRQLDRARGPEDLRAYADQVTSSAITLLDAGARVSDIGRVVAVSNDALIARILHDAEQALGPPPCAYGFLALGSEGRLEQTLRTDQDNALVIADDAPPEAEAYFDALARRVVDGLVACGFPLCPGDIMATNPRWRRPLRAWQRYFHDWIHVPDEEALLRSAIFFDYRQVGGALDVEGALRPIIRAGKGNGVFLGRMARAALRNPAPFGFFQQLQLERKGKQRDLLDLKMRGTALIIDLARLFALEAGVDAHNTIERLRQSAGASNLDPTTSEELIAAFELVGLLRLRHQVSLIKQGRAPDNLVSIGELTPMERREIKESLRAVERTQKAVEFAFQTGRLA